MKVLLIDDDKETGQLLQASFAEVGIELTFETDAKMAFRQMQDHSNSIIILDWNMPEISGLELCTNYRNSGGNTPIIFVTGRHSVSEKEIAFQAGADDYLSKPFDFRELFIRIKNLSRRSHFLKKEQIQIGEIVLDTETRQLFNSAKSVELSQTETNIVHYLLKNINKIVSADELLTYCTSPSESSDKSVMNIRVHINSIRNKADSLGMPLFIRTVRGRGYLILNKAN